MDFSSKFYELSSILIVYQKEWEPYNILMLNQILNCLKSAPSYVLVTDWCGRKVGFQFSNVLYFTQGFHYYLPWHYRSRFNIHRLPRGRVNVADISTVGRPVLPYVVYHRSRQRGNEALYITLPPSLSSHLFTMIIKHAEGEVRIRENNWYTLWTRNSQDNFLIQTFYIWLPDCFFLKITLQTFWP